jgi:hypothetical protein
MIVHQAIGMNLPPGLLAGFGEGLEEILPVHIVEEDVLAPVTAAHDVVNGAWKFDSQFSRHGDIGGETMRPVN